MDFLYKLFRDLIHLFQKDQTKKYHIPLIYIQEIISICNDLIETEDIISDKVKYLRAKLHSYSENPPREIRVRLSENDLLTIKWAVMGARTYYWIRTSDQLADPKQVAAYILTYGGAHASGEHVYKYMVQRVKDSKFKKEIDRNFEYEIESIRSSILEHIACLSKLETVFKIKLAEQE